MWLCFLIEPLFLLTAGFASGRVTWLGLGLFMAWIAAWLLPYEVLGADWCLVVLVASLVASWGYLYLCLMLEPLPRKNRRPIAESRN